ncbi:LysR substrate-binding domain-containing protein [Micromonospora sp. DR5-3]|uniref:LysR family transcriptional regulator n=1 Tax=unclassified Micromonospora TaxID=2617518 RepID=UPI0011D4EBF6|nr:MULTISPECIES: LysR substrate-binding domain-containing protein [unclassified Micromonospora]MCW3820511.1 LysR substrate-binding domain-containing protein [Micromonospora sp. DR5-3]TYC21813.1 LysR family transcriptional regulator [Micromonospora sp. MP36]
MSAPPTLDAWSDLRRLRYFAVLAEELHFTRAAARLHIAQPALSQQIRALERQLGVPLVQRTSRGCTLTEVGARVAGEAARLLAEVDAGTARIRDLVRGRGYRLRLAYTRSARGGRVDALVARFRAAHPDVEVVPETAWTAPNVAGLLAGRLDAAFVRPPVDEPALACRIVDTEELLLALPAGHPLAAGRRRISRAEVVDLPAVMWPRENGPGMFDRTIAQVWPHGGFNLVRQEPDDEQLLRAVAQGDVVAAVPAGRARALRLREVRLRRFTAPMPTVDVALAWPRDSTNPALRRFLALLE